MIPNNSKISIWTKIRTQKLPNSIWIILIILKSSVKKCIYKLTSSSRSSSSRSSSSSKNAAIKDWAHPLSWKESRLALKAFKDGSITTICPVHKATCSNILLVCVKFLSHRYETTKIISNLDWKFSLARICWLLMIVLFSWGLVAKIGPVYVSRFPLGFLKSGTSELEFSLRPYYWAELEELSDLFMFKEIWILNLFLMICIHILNFKTYSTVIGKIDAEYRDYSRHSSSIELRLVKFLWHTFFTNGNHFF